MKTTVAFAAIIATLSATTRASAISLSAADGGTFTFSYDSAALGTYAGGAFFSTNGFYLANFWNTSGSDYSAVTDATLAASVGTTPLANPNVTHDITATAATDPSGQASGRRVLATTPDFSVDSNTLAGTGVMGMTGVQGFYLPLLPGALVYGDFAFKYDASRSFASGWVIENGLSGIIVPAYDTGNLSLTVTDANNWQLTGDLLMSPENGAFLSGDTLRDVGNFCVGVGTYAGCGVTAPVPVPAAFWLFGSALAATFRIATRRSV